MKELLKLAEIPRSTFYYHLKQSKRIDKYKKIKEEIFSIFHENKGRYGYRRIALELKNRGFIINHKTVYNLMKTLGLQSIQGPKRKYTSYKGTIGKIPDNTNLILHSDQGWQYQMKQY